MLLPGYLAVQVFYVISGFYMALIYNEKYLKAARPKYLFYTNRLLRIYPVYFLVILMVIGLSILFGFWLGSFGKLQYYIDAYRANDASLFGLIVVGITNITLVGQDIVSFFKLTSEGKFGFLGLQSEMQLQEFLLIPIAWTVAVELFFYALAPFIVGRKILHVVLCVIAVLLLRLVLFTIADVNGDFDIYRFAPTELIWFLLGVLSYRLGTMNYLPSPKYGVYFWMALVSALLLYPFHQLAWMIFCVVFVCMPAIFHAVSLTSYDRYLGELTYPLYIGHMFFLMIVSANRFPKAYGTAVPLFLLSLAFSVGSHHFIQKRLERFRASRLR